MAHDDRRTYPIRSGGEGQPPAVSLTGIELDTYRVYRPGEAGPPPEEAASEFSLRDVLYTLFRHKWKIVTLFVLSSVATAIYVTTAADYYSSEARVFVRGDRAGLVVDPTARGDSILSPSRGISGSDVMRSEMGIMQSAAVAEMVVDKLGPQRVLYTPVEIAAMEAPAQAAPAPAEDASLKTRLVATAGRAADTVMKALNLKPGAMGEREAAIRKINMGVEIKPTMGGSSVLLLTYRARSPKQAQQTLQAVLEAYEAKDLEAHGSQFSPEFFTKRSEELKAALAEKENTLERRRKELDIASLVTEMPLRLTEVSNLDSAIKQVSAQIQELGAQQESLKKSLEAPAEADPQGADFAPLVSTDPALDEVRREYFTLKSRESDLSKRYKDNNRELRDTRARIKDLEEMLSGDKKASPKVRQATSPALLDLKRQYQTLQVTLTGAIARKERMASDLAEAQSRLAKLTANQKELERLEREVATTEAKYKQFMNGAQTMEIERDLDQSKVSNVSVVQPATLPPLSDKNQRKLLAILLFGVIAGLAGGIALAFILEFFDHSFKTSEDVEKKLGLPVLVALPRIRGHRPEPREETA